MHKARIIFRIAAKICEFPRRREVESGQLRSSTARSLSMAALRIMVMGNVSGPSVRAITAQQTVPGMGNL